jgi:hypothetical protein
MCSYYEREATAMKLLAALYGRLKSLLKAAFRFPVTFVFVCAIAVLNAISIQNSNVDFSKLVLSLVLGSFIYAVFQVLFEKYSSKIYYRIIFMASAAAITTGYYFLIAQFKTVSTETSLRTMIALFAMLMLFILIPSIKSKASFNNTFMIFFKAVFTSAFFSAIIWGGITLIISAIDSLLFKVNGNIYNHVVNIIWVVFAPTFFLSLIPSFAPGNENELKIEKAALCPKFLSILISYVLIPLVEIFSVVLIIYIVKSFGSSFWTNNLLEPLILSYAIAIIILTILASDISNKFAVFYRAVFPKILVPVVIFQLISSFINVFSSGITLMRYFVLIFGLYACIAGVLLSFLPVRKNGIIAAVIIVFSIISICPPVDVFTVSRVSQISLLESTLKQDNMLVDNKLVAKDSISQDDKDKIVGAMQNLNDMQYLNYLKWLPSDFNYDNDFESQFGFPSYTSGFPKSNITNVNFQIDSSNPVPISSYDFMQQINVDFSNDTRSTKISSFTASGTTYSLYQDTNMVSSVIKITDSSGNTVISYNFKEAYDALIKNSSSTKVKIPVSQMTFIAENSKAKMEFIIQNANITLDKGSVQMGSNASVQVLFSIK